MHAQPGDRPEAHTGHRAAPPQEGRTARPTEEEAVTARPAARATHPGDIGRRLADARVRSGLSLEETAERARMSPQYLAYLEQRPSDPTPATLLRLADVLGTTLEALRGGDQDLPPGRGQALAHPRLTDLSPEECRSLLSTHGVGRIALRTGQGPAVLPVNYDVVDDAVVFRTAADATPAAAVGAEVAFEVDHIDDAMSQGWSVLAVGTAEAVTDPEAVERLERRAHSAPWAGGTRPLWVRVRPARLTGRRITPGGR
jgi:transcriptional regulator with XRE-family HTH domain